MSYITCNKCKHWDNKTPQGDDFDDREGWGVCKRIDSFTAQGISSKTGSEFVVTHNYTAENFSCIFAYNAIHGCVEDFQEVVEQLKRLSRVTYKTAKNNPEKRLSRQDLINMRESLSTTIEKLSGLFENT